MITIVSATNRKESNTLKVANEYLRMLQIKKIDAQILNMEDIPASIALAEIYDVPNPEFEEFQEKYLLSADKFIFILPEYNGSMPGILKLMIDVADIKRAFYGKKALLVGVATGRAGNLRGMDHLTGVLNHMKMPVHWNKLPISKVSNEFNAENKFQNAITLKVVEQQIDEFITF